MPRQSARFENATRRATLLDVLHIAAILSCSVWTAKLIIEDRFGSMQLAAARAMHGLHPAQPHPTLKIRLDDVHRSVAR